ncbi:Arc family DNA-binding protein [Pectobacterium parvum]|uniref:Arc family DNA-binding protein n=1 Tax=Pectobacterium parvum TaxID=2778550 RepID=UPI001E4ABB01|nr:Arc family DNA-binding protein [Pectobacterium parvum]UFK38508.1 Arc family DNA-binding protein [Pectobacterium parvum]
MARDEPKINIRLPQELKEELHSLAARNKRSVNAEAVAAIEKALRTAQEIDEARMQQQEIADRLITAEVQYDREGADKYYKLLEQIEKRLRSLEERLG